MHIVHTDEQRTLAGILRALLAEASPPDRVAEIADGPDTYDAALWRRLAAELGVTGLLVPEQYGGAGASWREVAAVAGELGRSLACVPFLSSCVIAVAAIEGTGDGAAAAELLPGIASGDVIATVAAADPTGAITEDGVQVEAERVGDAWQLHGAVDLVIDGVHAQLFLVLARTDDGLAWFALERGTSGLEVAAMAVMDTTRPLATLHLAAAPARLLGATGDGWATAQSVIDAATVGLACEQAAASEHLLEMSVSYARERLQFGRPIGSFQAIQHRLADLQLLVDEARSAVELAIWAAADEPDERRATASLAGVVCGEVMRTVARETIQVHGGIGFTWEHPAHRYFRRAHLSSVAFGSPAVHRERLLAANGV